MQNPFYFNVIAFQLYCLNKGDHRMIRGTDFGNN